MMKSVIEEHDSICVIRLDGKLDIGIGDVHLCKQLDEAMDRGFTNIVVDMHKVSYADSSGIGELVNTYIKLQNNGVELCLANLHTKLYDLLSLTRLITVLPIFDSVEDAMLNLYSKIQPRLAAVG